MANMSYCRWQNTYNDLRDCVHTLPGADSDDEPTIISSEEKAARERTFELMAQALEAIGIDVDLNELNAAVAALNKESP